MGELKLSAALIWQYAVSIRDTHLESFLNILEVEQTAGELGYHQSTFYAAEAGKGYGIERDTICGKGRLLLRRAGSKLLGYDRL